MTNSREIKVLKASGEYETFSEEKVRRSLQRVGADVELIKKVLNHLKTKLYEGIPTSKIYFHVFDILEREKSPLVFKYNLKRAIMELGPSGYPFEKFIAGVLGQYNYKTKVGEAVEGRCAEHEIDVIAEKENKRYMIECKFHNRPGTRSDIKDTLYIYARFLDLKEQFSQGWLVTNTKATSEALSYAKCVGLNVISWDYPKDFSLRYLIEKSNLHPITCLENLSKGEKRRLLERGIIFVRDLKDEEYSVLP